MKMKLLFTGIIILEFFRIFPTENLETIYQIKNNSMHHAKSCSKQDFFYALQLLLVYNNTGYLSYSDKSIHIAVWEKYDRAPTTIHPIYSIKLTKGNPTAVSTLEQHTTSSLNSVEIKIMLESLQTETAKKASEMFINKEDGIIVLKK